MGRWAIRLLAVALGLYLAIVGALWARQEAFIFPGWNGPSAERLAEVPGLSEITIPGLDGPDLRAWSKPAEGGRPTLVMFHGNAGHQWEKITAYAGAGYGVLMPAYRGFAGNDGTPSEAGLIADGRATLAHAAAEGLRPEEIILYGESLGTGIAARMALEPGAWRGLVLDMPYTSVRDRAAERFPWVPVGLLIRHPLDTLAIVGDIDTPLLVIHGTADRTIPVHHGRAVFAAAAKPKALVIVEGGTHWLPPGRILAAMDAFLDP